MSGKANNQKVMQKTNLFYFVPLSEKLRVHCG